ncbi:N-acetyllactosaminide beta-1 6-N-acetylglucosaminyl-transferase isoform C [Fasciola gigantica]|uniref:N-acetyllactosaminide beta-1 6-N-acetylglucosaminyl-transferase isoform C n=1 Tax=Fasciola gigantica TaxID=46835 RepID=A0A504Y5Q2_FASGI|nr:N-acetyllactosaminide beta-1 6-N-acetylglucosaminyl-transferase isoform C [Fasciola gigantica]
MVAVFWYSTNSLVLRHTIFYAFIIFLLYMIAFYVPLRRIHKPKNELADYQVLTDTGTLWLPRSLTQTEAICPILISPKLNEHFADTLTKITRTDQTNINLNQIDDCPQFKQIHGDQPSVSVEELQFPLAFSFNIHKQFTQFARLFRAVFRHHNAYCIHVDYKADREFRKQVMRLVNCFGPNVYVIPRERSISVKWGDLSTLEAWIRCAEFLLNQSSVRWKYLLNGSGQEFPLRTNWELVRALKAINGSNIVESNDPNTDIDWVPNKSFSFNFTQFARLFRAVFRHHNAYCIHVDYKADREFRKQVMRLVNCFGPNVYVIPRERSISVKWGDLSTLEAWIRCAEFLLNQSSVRWKYLLNGSGQEFPLRTNWELVRALKAINGSNIVESNDPNTDIDWVPNKSFSFNVRWKYLLNGSGQEFPLRKQLGVLVRRLEGRSTDPILSAIERS